MKYFKTLGYLVYSKIGQLVTFTSIIMKYRIKPHSYNWLTIWFPLGHYFKNLSKVKIQKLNLIMRISPQIKVLEAWVESEFNSKHWTRRRSIFSNYKRSQSFFFFIIGTLLKEKKVKPREAKQQKQVSYDQVVNGQQ